MRPSITLRGCFVAHSRIGILLNSFGPDPVLHQLEHNVVRIVDSIIVGRPLGSVASCDTPMSPSFRSFAADHPRWGLVLPSFTQRAIGSEQQLMAVQAYSYPALSGAFFGVNLTFVDFDDEIPCSHADNSDSSWETAAAGNLIASYAIASNPFAPIAHTHSMINSTFLRVPHS